MEPPTISKEIRHHYQNEVDEDGRTRRGLGRLEFARVQEIVRRHLPARPTRVLDVGGATGVHAEWLLADGHEVHLIDPVASQVESALERLGGHERFSAEVGDARALPTPPNAYGAVLLFGPLYHLWEAEERLMVWREASRVAGPGGLIFAIGVTRFASLLDGLASGYLFDPDFRKIAQDDLATGRHRNPDSRPGWFTTAYFHRPDELAAEATEAGITVRQLVGLEGMAGWLPSLADRWDRPEDRETILDSARWIESEPSLIGLSAHLLLVAECPAEGTGS